MIIVNGVPKSGGWMMVNYFTTCGCELEPGGLMAYHKPTAKLRQATGKPWDKYLVRPVNEVLADYSRKRVISGHFNSCVDLPGHDVVFVYRHPRDVLVSHARWRAVDLDWTGKTEPSRAVVDSFMHNTGIISTLLRQHRDFYGWLEKGIPVKFSDFVSDKNIARDLCAALDLPYHDPAESLCGNAPWVTKEYRGTWSGNHSHWEEFWDSTVDSLWQQYGGPEVETLYGFRD